jgi:hypothetical protein
MAPEATDRLNNVLAPPVQERATIAHELLLSLGDGADAHRPLLGDEDLEHIFALQEDRKLSSNLVVHFQRMADLVASGPDTLPPAGKTIRVYRWEDGRVELQHQGRQIPYSVFDKNPCIPQGVIVEHERLGAALALNQAERDRAKLASRTLTIREKDRVRAARSKAAAASLEPSPTPKNRTFLLGRRADISTWG